MTKLLQLSWRHLFWRHDIGWGKERELHQHVKLILVRSSAHFISLGAQLDLQTSSGYTCNKLPILLDVLSLDETPCFTVKTWRFGETYCLYLRRRNVLWRPSLTCSIMDDVTGWHGQKCRRYCFHPEDGGVGTFLSPDDTVHKPRRQPTSFYLFFPSSWYSSCLSFSLFIFFFTFSVCYLFDISLFFCFLRTGLLFGTAFIFFHPGVCNTSTTWRSHSILQTVPETQSSKSQNLLLNRT
jgi:hypothetical protein